MTPAMRVPAWTVEGLSDVDLGLEVVFDLVRTWDPGRLASDPRINDGQRAVAALVAVDEVHAGGGLLAVMRFMSPLQLTMALDGADRVGAPEHRDRLAAACRLVFGDELPRNEAEEEAAWDDLESRYGSDLDATNPWAELDLLVDRAGLYAGIVRYIRSHCEEFFTDETSDAATPATRLAFADAVVAGPDGWTPAALARARRIIEGARTLSETLGDRDAIDACTTRLAVIAEVLALDPIARRAALGHRGPDVPDA